MVELRDTRLCHLLVGDYGLRRYKGWNGHQSSGFSALAWKFDGESGIGRDLVVNFKGNFLTFALTKRKVLPVTALAIEIAWPLTPPIESWESDSADLVRVVGPSNDPEILSLERMRRSPQRQFELAMGRFERNDELGWIEGKIDWLGRQTKAILEAELDIDIPAQEAVLAQLIADQKRWDSLAREAIASGLYDLWLDTWRDDKPIVSEHEFASRMPLDSIGTNRDGEFEMWFDDADFFWGHSVLVRGSLAGGLELAEMHG